VLLDVLRQARSVRSNLTLPFFVGHVFACNRPSQCTGVLLGEAVDVEHFRAGEFVYVADVLGGIA